MVQHVLANLADGRSLFEKAKQVDRQHLLIGKVRIGVVALPLGHRSEATPIVPTDEQVDPNERMLTAYVAKGGLVRRCLVAPSSNRPRRRGFFNP